MRIAVRLLAKITLSIAAFFALAMLAVAAALSAAYEWAVLHSVYGGDAIAQDKDEWRHS